LTDGLNTSASAVARLLKRLESEKFILRERDRADGRAEVALGAASADSSSRSIDPDLPAIYSDRTIIQGRDPPFELWLEPGAIAFRLDSTRRLEVVCRRPVRGRMEFERLEEGHITLYAWEHATFTVLEQGREIFVQERPLSLSMGEGDTPRKRVEFIFGDFERRRAMQPNRWL
jgi:DNA-binding Lrp family transcriptional regulator